MIILNKPITIDEIKKMASGSFGDMVKSVVDVEQEKIALDAELHSDLESLLIDQGSLQNNLWGINLYPDLEVDDFVEFDSMINVRPNQGNLSRDVENEDNRIKIIKIINYWIKR